SVYFPAGAVPIYLLLKSKYAGGNPVWEFFTQSPKHLEKETKVPEEPGCSGIGKRRRKACPLSSHPAEDESPSEGDQI
uniref:Uncharacterized protein n=1 Tax=Podarcis muralis TaxID=64176 RepID=A0A670JZT0_PODMU